MTNEVAGLSRRNFLRGRVTVPAADTAGTQTAHIATVGPGCLAAAGTDCQLCRDACPEGAIAFVPRRGGPFLPSIRAALCTGCSDCLPVCPTAALHLAPTPEAPNA